MKHKIHFSGHYFRVLFVCFNFALTANTGFYHVGNQGSVHVSPFMGYEFIKQAKAELVIGKVLDLIHANTKQQAY